MEHLEIGPPRSVFSPTALPYTISNPFENIANVDTVIEYSTWSTAPAVPLHEGRWWAWAGDWRAHGERLLRQGHRVTGVMTLNQSAVERSG